MSFEIDDFKLGTNSDIIRKQLIAGGVETITTEQISSNEFGLIVNWYFDKIQMTFSKQAKIAPYTLMCIQEIGNE